MIKFDSGEIFLSLNAALNWLATSVIYQKLRVNGYVSTVLTLSMNAKVVMNAETGPKRQARHRLSVQCCRGENLGVDIPNLVW